MRKREAEKLEIGDFVFAPGIGIYANDQRRIVGIFNDENMEGNKPLFLVEGEGNRHITYLHLKKQQEVIRKSDPDAGSDYAPGSGEYNDMMFGESPDR